MSDEIVLWTKGDVREWIFSLGHAFEQYGESLYRDGINGDDLLEDFDTILEEIQFSKNSHKNKMLREWGKLQKNYEDAVHRMSMSLNSEKSDLSSFKSDLSSFKSDLSSHKGDLSSPESDLSSPAGGASSPAGGASSPAGGESSPAGDLSSPADDLSSPAGDLSSPAGDLSSPAGDLSSPKNDPSSGGLSSPNSEIVGQKSRYGIIEKKDREQINQPTEPQEDEPEPHSDLPDSYADFNKSQEETSYVELDEGSNSQVADELNSQECPPKSYQPPDALNFDKGSEDEGLVPDEDTEKVTIFNELSIPEVKPILRVHSRTNAISQDELTSVQRLGSGYFGITYRCCYTPKHEEETTMDVVVKVAKENHDGDDIREIQIFSQLKKSDNVLPIVGLCKNFQVKGLDPRLAIVTPFQEHGDLNTLVENNEWTEIQLVNIALGMARGVQQLHAQEVIHRDIAPRNYLIGKSGRILITDFGLSRNVDRTDEEKVYYIHNVNSQLPWRSSAPETLEGRKSGKSSDIWMFGVCVWSFVNGRTPFEEFKSPTALALGLERGFKLEHRQSCPVVIREIIDACCTRKSSERPSIADVVSKLLSQRIVYTNNFSRDALNAFLEKKYDDAIKLYDEIVKFDPSNQVWIKKLNKVKHLAEASQKKQDDGFTTPPTHQRQLTHQEMAAAKMIQMREMIVKEILSTEVSYVEALEVLNKLYIIPLLAFTCGSNEVISQDAIDAIFSNIQLIRGLNIRFLSDLKERADTWTDTTKLGDVFIQFAPFFKMYTSYVDSHDAAFVALKKQLQSNSKFSQFCEEKERLPESQTRTLTSFLIMPVQRLQRYQLLLEELIRNTPVDHNDFQDLTEALTVVKDIVAKIKNAINLRENGAVILRIQAQFQGDVTFIKEGRIFIRKGPLTKLSRRSSRKKYIFFLFSDLLVYAAKLGSVYRLHRKIPIDGAFVVQDLPDDSHMQNKFQISTRNKSFMVVCDDWATKNSWLDDLSQCISLQKSTNPLFDPSDASSLAPIWQPDHTSKACSICAGKFSIFNRRHHCRRCGSLVCGECSKTRAILRANEGKKIKRVCDRCILGTKKRSSSLEVPGSSADGEPLLNGDESDLDGSFSESSSGDDDVDDSLQFRCKALFAYTGDDDSDLVIKEGDIITVLDKHHSGWWTGELNGKAGMFPSTYVEVLPD